MNDKQTQDKALASSTEPKPIDDYLGDGGRRQSLKITIPNIKLNAINEFCEHFDISKSTFIEKCLDFYLFQWGLNSDSRLWCQRLYFFKKKGINQSDIFQKLNKKNSNIFCTLCVNKIDSPSSAIMLNNVHIDKYDEKHAYVVIKNTYGANITSELFRHQNQNNFEMLHNIDRGSNDKLVIPFFHSNIPNYRRESVEGLNYPPEYLEYICYKIPLEYIWDI